MAHYAPCFNCAVDKNTCERRQSIRRAIQGSGILSLKFRCNQRQPMFSPGQRVSFVWTWWDNCGEGDDQGLGLVFHGTVIRESGAKFVVQVDAGKDASGEECEASHVFTKNDQLLIKVRPADMRALSEPPRHVCSVCSWVEGAAEDRCQRTPPEPFYSGYTPTGCALSAAISTTKEG